ncbi:hypothetical protein ACOSQ4_020484 [Xanthoceras sorbifolium]
MAQIKVVSWVLVVCLMLFLVNTGMVLSHEEIIPQATSCCKEHPELGHCEKGKDDTPNATSCCKEHPELGHCDKGKDDAPNGKCTKFCSQECRRGECKNRNGKWQCFDVVFLVRRLLIYFSRMTAYFFSASG